MESKVIMTVDEMQSRSKWLEARNAGIGGSDAGIILGVSQWKSPFSLWLEKTNQVPIEESEGETEEQTEAMHFGNVLEEVVAREFCERTGKKVRRCGLMQNIKDPWMLASVDRLIVGENAGLECKTAAAWKADDWAEDKIPDTYYCQVCHYLLCTGLDRWYIACLVGGQKFIWKCIERKDVENDLKALYEAEKQWWEEFVVGRTMPPPDGSAACTEAIKSMFKGGGTEAAELDSDIDSACLKLDELNSAIKQLTNQKKEIENKVRVAMMDAEYGRSVHFNVSYKTSSRSTFDKDRFEKECPGVYEKYTKNTPIRTLYVRKKAAYKDK